MPVVCVHIMYVRREGPSVCDMGHTTYTDVRTCCIQAKTGTMLDVIHEHLRITPRVLNFSATFHWFIERKQQLLMYCVYKT